MVQSDTKLDHYFSTVQQKGHIISEKMAHRWSTAVLKTLGLNLDKKSKKSLADTLPKPLAEQLNRVFWLAHFRDTNLPLASFQQMVARRAGHSDPQYAKMAITAVFHGLKGLIDSQTSQTVAQSLSPELREFWQNA